MNKHEPFIQTAAQDTEVTGCSLPSGDFRIVETYQRPDPAVIRKLLQGEAAGMLVRRCISQAACRAATRAFMAAASHDRPDDVAAVEVGVGHYGKSTSEYLDAVRQTEAAFAQLFKKGDSPKKLDELIRKSLTPGHVLRRAVHQGQQASPYRAARWKQTGQYALLMHEDFSQLTILNQRGFEIQRVTVPVAVNAYHSTSEQGGGLRVWNMSPDEATRRRLGILHSGHPYPAAGLSGVPFIDIAIETGDVFFLNGTLIHAVEKSDGATPRIVVNGFIGLVGQEVLQWT